MPILSCLGVALVSGCLTALLSLLANLFNEWRSAGFTNLSNAVDMPWLLWTSAITGLGGFYMIFFLALREKEYLNARSDRVLFLVAAVLGMIVVTSLLASNYSVDETFSVKSLVVGIAAFLVGIPCSVVITQMIGGLGISLLQKSEDES